MTNLAARTSAVQGVHRVAAEGDSAEDTDDSEDNEGCSSAGEDAEARARTYSNALGAKRPAMASPQLGVAIQSACTVTAAQLRQQAYGERSAGRQDEGDGAANGAEVEPANDNSATDGVVAELCGTSLQPRGAVSKSTARTAISTSSEASEEKNGKASKEENTPSATNKWPTAPSTS